MYAAFDWRSRRATFTIPSARSKAFAKALGDDEALRSHTSRNLRDRAVRPALIDSLDAFFNRWRDLTRGLYGLGKGANELAIALGRLADGVEDDDERSAGGPLELVAEDVDLLADAPLISGICVEDLKSAVAPVVVTDGLCPAHRSAW